MNFVGLALHGFKALMVFAEDVLVRTGIACASVATLSLSGGVVALILYVNGFAIPDWLPIAMSILFLVFMQTGILSLMILLLTGMLRSSLPATVNYKEYIDKIQYTDNLKQEDR